MGTYLVPSVTGVTMLDLSTALVECPDLVHPHLGSLVPLDGSHPLSGTFVHVAAGVVVADPLQTFFGREAERMAATSRTLIVAEADSSVAYLEGCAAPIYARSSDRSSTVEVIVGVGATVRHATIQNWSTNVQSTVTKHATVQAAGRVEWLDAALGSSQATTRLATRLGGTAASASVLSMISAGKGQNHEAEILIAHEAPQTSSVTLSKLLGSDDGSITSRHALQMGPASGASRAVVRSETLLIDGLPDVSDTIDVSGDGAVAGRLEHSTVDGRIDETHVRYLMRRGMSRAEAVGMMVTGYLEPIARSLPLEYAIEWEQAIQLDIARAIG